MRNKRKRPGVIPLHVSIHPEQHAVIVHVSKDIASDNLSATVRYIVTDWVRMKRAAFEAATIGMPQEQPA